MNDYFLILTTKGKAKVAEAILNNSKINITHIVFGDGDGNVVTPTPTWTKLAHEVYRAEPTYVGIHKQNENWIVLKGYIPKDVGNWFIREVGIYDDKGDLIAVGNYPDMYKPTVSLGVGVDVVMELILEVSDVTAITLQLDPSKILVTQDEMEEYVKQNAGRYDNVGMMEFSMRLDVPSGKIRADGIVYSAETSTAFANFYDNYLNIGKFRTCSFLEYEIYLKRNGGECGYFGLDRTNRKFRVPLIKNGSALCQASSLTELAAWYNCAIENIKGYFTTQQGLTYGNNDDKLFKTVLKGKVDSGNSNNGDWVNRTEFDASRVVRTSNETRNRQLRYPILITIANSSINDEVKDNIWNDFLSALGSKANADLSNVGFNDVTGIDCVIQVWQNGTNWYRKYKSGWIEQGGREAASTASFTLFVPMRDTNYSVYVSNSRTTSSGNNDSTIGAMPIDEKKIQIFRTHLNFNFYWQVKGYAQ